MVKARLRKWLPDFAQIREHRALTALGPKMRDPNLWHLNRRSVSGAVALGLFVAFLPLPLQMLIAGAIAIVIRVNLPISVALVWISNPLTMPPIFFSAYQIGRHILNEPRRGFNVEPSWTWLWTEALPLWKPLVLGSVVMGLIAAVAGYLVVRLLWRLAVLDYLAMRRRRPRPPKS
ncbi:MAG: DUF2062 domain-containing protein [Thioalkalivibrionaceae bacterium]